MRKILIGLSLATSLVLASSNAAPWGFEGKIAPEYWGDLAPEFEMCKKGKNQSPIDLKDIVEAELPPLKIDYNAKSTEVVNKGTTVQVDYSKGASFEADGKTFNLIQYHFHTPSENHINGKSFPLEAHFVHASDKGELAVIAVMFVEGKENPQIAKFIDKVPAHRGEKADLSSEAFNPIDLLPKDRDYYRFNGSLTTPPCSESVRWFVMKNPVEASKEQIEKFTKVFGHNNRPLNPLNARKVMQ